MMRMFNHWIEEDCTQRRVNTLPLIMITAMSDRHPVHMAVHNAESMFEYFNECGTACAMVCCLPLSDGQVARML